MKGEYATTLYFPVSCLHAPSCWRVAASLRVMLKRTILVVQRPGIEGGCDGEKTNTLQTDGTEQLPNKL